jgi:hypothetical protein
MSAVLASKIGLHGLAQITYDADGALSLEPQHALLDATSANTAMTLANGGDNMTGKFLLVECEDASNTCDVDYNNAAGAATETFTAAGQVLVLLNTANGVWKKLA